MPLRIVVPDCPDGLTHEILVKAPGTGDEFEIELVNHPDRAWDDMLEAMGGEHCECYRIEEILELGLQGVFEDPDFTTVFVGALRDQDIEALGMARETFATYVVDFVEWLLSNNEDWPGLFLGGIQALLPWVKHTNAFKENLYSLARLSYEQDNPVMFKVLNEMTDEQLITVHATDVEGEDNGIFAGHVRNETNIDFQVGGETIASWTFVWRGWFREYAPFRWYTEIEHIEEPNWFVLNPLLRLSGFVRDSDGIQDEYKPTAPELPNEKSDGGWAVTLNGYIHGRFATEEDAYATYDAMRDAGYFRGHREGSNAEVVHRAPDPERADDTDYQYDENDPGTWEAVVSDEV